MAGLCAVVPLYHALRFYRGLRIPVMIISVLVVAGLLAVLAYDRTPMVAILGKDATLTGRTELWEELLGLALRRPWLGYGFNGLWSVCSGSGRGWLEIGCLFGAHNGFLGLWLDLGIPGVVTFALAFAGATATAVAHSQSTRNAGGLWPVTFLTFLLLYNITEDAILRGLGLWIVFIATVGTLRVHPLHSSAIHRWREAPADLDSRGRPIEIASASLRVRPRASLGVRATFWARGRMHPLRKSQGPLDNGLSPERNGNDP